MIRLIKAFLSLVIVALVLVIIAAVAVALLANKAVRTAVETAGTKALNVPVTVGKADVALLSGSARLQNLRVANPAGYTGPALLTLQRADVTTDTGSLLSREILIKNLKLDALELFIEQKGLQNNLYDIIKPLREPRPATGKSLIVDNLEITNVVVHVGLSGVPGQAPMTSFKVAPIRMTELGRHEKMDTTILISKIVLAIAAGVTEQGRPLLPKDTLGELGSILDKATDLGKIIFGPKDNTQKPPPSDSDRTKSLPEGLQDLFGGKKKQ